jgi:predicted amidophosphoribosyltransferase
MLSLIIVVLFFGLMIGIFSRLGKTPRDRKTGAVCPSCRSNIDPRATVCPRCLRDVDRTAVVKQLKRGQIRAYLTATLVIVVIIIGYSMSHV